MPHEDRFSRVEIAEPDSPQSLARARRAEPAPVRRRGFSISLFWNVGVKITRPKRRSLSDAAERKPVRIQADPGTLSENGAPRS
jgi:hypothetical protein